MLHLGSDFLFSVVANEYTLMLTSNNILHFISFIVYILLQFNKFNHIFLCVNHGLVEVIVNFSTCSSLYLCPLICSNNIDNILLVL